MTVGSLRHHVGTLLGRPRRHHFLRRLPRGAVVAELGVFRGEFSRQILKEARPRELHLIDGWWELYGERFPDWGPYNDHGRVLTREAYEETVRAVERSAPSGTRWKIHVGDDCEILGRFPDGYFDWVYLDSSHQYEHTLRELRLLDAKVKPQGLITGHDWIEDPASVNHGAYLAIRDFCAETGWRLDEVDPFTQWRLSRAAA